MTTTGADAVAALVAAVAPVDHRVLQEAAAHHDRLTKPRGALGRLESLGAQLCAIADAVPPPVPHRPAVAVFAGDHGVHAEAVSPWPQEVTAQMVDNLCRGGAAVNVLARRAGATTVVVDVGVAHELEDHPALRRRRVRPGTANLAHTAAMTTTEACAALLVGAEVAAELLADGADLLIGGDMGIGNTTPSAALIAALCDADPVAATGRGTGIDDVTLQRKAEVVAAAVARATARHRAGEDPLAILAEVGGLEIAALAGFFLAGAAARVPVVVDGVITLAAACVAAAMCPAVTGYLVAGHRSTEPAATIALERLGLEPLVDLGLRLGEGSGAALTVPIVQAAAAVMAEMATFDGAGVTDKSAGGPP